MTKPRGVLRHGVLRALLLVAFAFSLNNPANAWQKPDPQQAVRPQGAQQVIPQIRAHQNTGRELARANRHAEAAMSFRQAATLLQQYFPNDTENLPTILYEWSFSLWRSGGHAEAEPIYRRALAMDERRLGPNHREVVVRVTNLAVLLGTVNRHAEAEPLYRRALAYFEGTEGREGTNTGSILNNLGFLLHSTGRHAEAIPLLERAIAIEARTLGVAHPQVGNTTRTLCEALRDVGQYQKAEIQCRASLRIAQQTAGPNSSASISRTSDVSIILQRLGRHEEAIVLAREVVTAQVREHGATHAQVASGLNNLASLLIDIGDYTAAEESIRRAIEIDQALGELDTAGHAAHLMNLAIILRTTGRYGEAERIYRSSVALLERTRGPDHRQTVAAKNNLAWLLEATGRRPEAEQLLRDGLARLSATLGNNHPSVGVAVNNLAYILRLAGNLEEAESLYRQSLAIMETAYGPQHPSVATALDNLAGILSNTGRAAEAEPLQRRAATILEQAFGSTHTLVAATLHNLGHTYDVLGRTADSESMRLRALHVAGRAGDLRALWTVQSNLLAHYSRRNPERAILFGKLAVNNLQRIRGELRDSERSTQQTFLATVSENYRLLARLLIEAGRLVEAQQVLAMLKEEEYHEFIRRDSSADVRQTMATLSAAEQVLVDRLNSTYPQGHEALVALVRSFGAASTSRPAPAMDDSAVSSIVAATPGTVLLQAFHLDDALFLLVTTGTERHTRRVETTAAALDARIEILLNSIKSPYFDPRPAAASLYELLVAPIEDWLPTDTRTLMVSLDGNLRYIPFAVLHDGERYLAERFAISVYNEAAGERVAPAPRAAGSRSAAGLGVSQAHGEFSALPAVPGELATIVRDRGNPEGIIPGQRWLDERFTASALSAALGQNPTVVHVASHFKFSPGTEHDNFLLLGDGTGLTLHQLRTGHYDFSAVDLLTLSACETAVGGSGNEVEGLAVTAQRRGARAVLATLWPVADDSTGGFMQRFYQLREGDGLDKAEALRQSQLEMLDGRLTGAVSDTQRGLRHSRDSTGAPFVPDPARPWAHPYYWAPFILMGDWL